MYSVDMKNIVPKECLTCLVAKATLDESILWHKRLGHVNFKTINKLVKENLMRGLPSKRFENNQTCVACLKGKQHKASCIKREFSIVRTPQKNGVAERRNRTLIEAARTMLADSKLPTTFWAEAVNTACYVQNRVLIVKPHNKTSYELFRGRTPALSFMRPFGCHITILNTLDYLGKFDGKSDEGLFVGYSLNSKASRVYNIRTRKVEENLHIRFLEDKPIIADDGPKWLFDIDVLTKSMNYVPVVAGTNSNDLVDGSLFDSSLKNASNDKPQPSSDAGKKDDEGVCKESGIADQEKSKNSTQGVNTAGPSINTEPDMFSLGDNATATHADFFGDETEVDMSNITTTYPVPSTPNTRIYKDHSLDHVIGDEEPKKVWTLVDLPLGKRAIGTKWVYRNKKDERGIIIRNKARLVSQGYTQEEGTDYDEVFAPVARIEANRLFLAYASFKDFVVYQIDVKSAFLYGKIEEEVYVCQPLGFEDLEFLDRVYKVEKVLYGLHQAPRAFEGVTDWYQSQGYREAVVMYSASSAVTYTSVYINSEPGRVFWRADDDEITDGGIPRVIVYGYDRLPMQPVAPQSPDYIPGPEDPQTPLPIYPEYIPLEDEHVFLVEEQPLPPVDSPTTESPGYVDESDPEEDPEEYEDDETEDGPVDYPMNVGDDGDDDDDDSFGDDADDEDEDEEDKEEEEEEEEHPAPADSAVVIPTIKPASISLPPEAEVERLLAMTTPSPLPPISLSPPSVRERLARCTDPPTHSSPPPVPSPLLSLSGCLTQIQTLRIASTQALIDAVTAALPSPPLPPSLYIPPPIDRRDDVPKSELPPRKSEVGYGIRDTWVDLAEAVPKIAPTTLGEVNTRVIELAELYERDT
ncbi:putative ribonuclease H-like domain-containing protein [Tanacetum coccineum]